MFLGSLILHKTLGCYNEFGLAETLRRIIREWRHLFKSAPTFDISLVTKVFGIGAAPRSYDFLIQLKTFGFRHLIDLRAERKLEDILAETDEILVHWVPTFDDWKPISPDFFRKLEIQIKSILASGDDPSFFICCGAGEHRAPLAGVLSLVVMGHSLEMAVEMIQKARPKAELLPVYLSSLKSYLQNRMAQSA
jgi:hypothetical protein